MKTIPVGHGKVALVDDEDWPVLSRFNWRISKYGYVTTRLKANKNYPRPQIEIKMHTLVMGATKWDRIPDHRFGDKLDCRKENLRWATPSQNAINWWRKNKYGRGVGFDPKRQRFRVIIFAKGLQRGLLVGHFYSAQEARDAYDEAALKYHGEFAMLNRDHWKPVAKEAQDGVEPPP